MAASCAVGSGGVDDVGSYRLERSHDQTHALQDGRAHAAHHVQTHHRIHALVVHLGEGNTLADGTLLVHQSVGEGALLVQRRDRIRNRNSLPGSHRSIVMEKTLAVHLEGREKSQREVTATQTDLVRPVRKEHSPCAVAEGLGVGKAAR